MRLLLALSILGCLACGAVHALTYAGYDSDGLRISMIGLFLGAFFIGICACTVKLAAPPGAESQFGFVPLLAAMPRWANRLMKLAVAYGIVSAMLMIALDEGQAWVEAGGVLTLRRDGHVVRILTPAEFRSHWGLVLRGLAGVMLVAYALEAATFLGVICQQRRWRRTSLQAASASTPLTSPAERVQLAYGHETVRLSVWSHQLLFNLSSVAGGLGMPLLVSWNLGRVLPPLVLPIAFFGSAIGSVQLVRFLFVRVFPARCPRCLGVARCESRSKETTYACRDCGYVVDPA